VLCPKKAVTDNLCEYHRWANNVRNREYKHREHPSMGRNFNAKSYRYG